MVAGAVVLKGGRDTTVRARHPWVFSGAVQRVEGRPEAGATVDLLAANGDFLGRGAWSPQSQIVVRLWTVADETIDAAFFARRLRQALEYRRQLGITGRSSGYRLINAESDGLPGLVADVYGDWLVLQILTVGAELWRQTLADAMMELLPLKGVYERSDVEVRGKEGLAARTGPVRGEPPPQRLPIEEDGRNYLVDPLHGHKTGFYLDQRDNRSLLQQFAADRSLLNCFAYTGGFAIAGLRGGARHVVNVEASQPALNLALENLRANGLEVGAAEQVCGDVFQVLRGYRAEGRQFDMVVLDPPKFADSRKRLPKAARGYKDINLLGWQLLRPGGLLFTFSCSGLMDSGLFQKIVADAAADAGCDARILRRLQQGDDHPTRLAFPEGHYLKGLLCQK